jgi:hypothetical protein
MMHMFGTKISCLCRFIAMYWQPEVMLLQMLIALQVLADGTTARTVASLRRISDVLHDVQPQMLVTKQSLTQGAAAQAFQLAAQSSIRRESGPGRLPTQERVDHDLVSSGRYVGTPQLPALLHEAAGHRPALNSAGSIHPANNATPQVDTGATFSQDCCPSKNIIST